MAKRSRAGWSAGGSKAPKKVEERNFDIRKNLLEYDEVMDEQRKRVYGFRQDILNGGNCKIKILDMIDRQIDTYLADFLDKDYGASTFAKAAGGELGIELDPRDYRGMDFQTAEARAKEEAAPHGRGANPGRHRRERAGRCRADRMELGGLAKFANTRWKLNLPRPRFEASRPRRAGRDAAGKGPRSDRRHRPVAIGGRPWTTVFGVRTACGWVQFKFGLQLDPEEIKKLDANAFIAWSAIRPGKLMTKKRPNSRSWPARRTLPARDVQGKSVTTATSSWPGPDERFQIELDVDDLRNVAARGSAADAGRVQQAALAQADRTLAEAQQRGEDLRRRRGFEPRSAR